MACLSKTIRTRTVKDSVYVLGFSALILRELPKTQNKKVIKDKFLFLECIRIRVFDVECENFGARNLG